MTERTTDYTSSYGSADDQARPLAVPYSFRGSLVGEDELAAVRRVIQSGESLTGGKEVAAFESEFAKFTQARHSFAVSSCTAALFIAQQLAGLGSDTELIAPPLSFVASVLPALHLGARVVFADVDPLTLNLDPQSVRARITSRTRAIVAVHYAGCPADMTALRQIADEHGLVLIEDAAHAVGAKWEGRPVGSLGDFAAFSFHSLKNMTTLGEGGMLTFSSDKYASAVARLRSMGLQPYEDQEDYWLPYHYDVVAPGGALPWNFRMNEAAAAVGRVQLGRLEEFNARRKQIAERLNTGLADLNGLSIPMAPAGAEHVWHLYTLMLADEFADRRDALVRELYRKHGVQPILHYRPMYHFTIFNERLDDEANCPVAESAFGRLFNLPIHPGLADEQVDYMIAAVRAAFQNVVT